MSNSPNTISSNIKVRRASVDSVDLYEVKEHELIQLEKGSDADLFLNFAIFLFSTAFTCSLSLVSATFSKPVYQTTAIVITVVGYLGSLLLLLLWVRNRKNVKDTIKQIRNRLPAEIIPSNDQDAIAIKSREELQAVKTDIQDTTKPMG